MGEPQNYNSKEIIYRVGTFFLLIGIGLLVFFLLSETTQDPQFNYFCGGVVILVIGFMFRAQYRKMVPASGRFGILRRIFSRRGGDKDE